MNLSISGAQHNVFDLEVLHEKDGKQLQGKCGRLNLGSRVLGTLQLLSPFTFVRFFG